MALPRLYRLIILTAVIFITELPSFSQNTKGDKPAAVQRSIYRIPRVKSKKKGGDRPFTGDITGRRIRTKNKSSAVRAVQTGPLPYARKHPKEVSRVGRPLGGGLKVRIHSSTAEAARNNVYPSQGPYAFNPSRKPHDTQTPFSNRSALSRVASWISGRPSWSNRRVNPRSASRSFVTRGRKNTYWGKLRIGERPITTDIAGRSLRAKNFHSPGLGVMPAPNVYRRKKRPADRPYKGPFKSGFVTSAQRSHPWTGDISGHPIRRTKPKTQRSPRYFLGATGLSNSAAYRSSRAIAVRYPGQGIGFFKRFLNKVQGVRNPKGGGSASRGFNNSGRPINVRTPGIGSNVGSFRGNIRGNGKSFSQEGLDFSGSIKSGRPLRGGGSNSGFWNNGNRAIDVRSPGIGANMGNFSGRIRGREKSFSQQGLAYSGNLKTRRPLKGGGSVSGFWNNGNRAIDVRTPGIGANMGNFSGNLKSTRKPKGGGSISGKGFNNSGNPINVRAPGAGAKYVGGYQGFFRSSDVRKGFSQDGLSYSGNIRSGRPLKGGGSISGAWNNNGNPINVRVAGPGAGRVGTYRGFFKTEDIAPGFAYQGETYKGSIKAGRPVKGGGSITTSWNNNGRPLDRRATAPSALKIGVYSGNLRAKRPEKGGGSISGKIWNNNQRPILSRTPLSSDAKDAAYSGRIRLPFFRSKYIRNPNSNKDAIKVNRPSKSVYSQGDLLVKVKREEFGKNKVSAKDAIEGRKPGKNSVNASEYDGRMKMLWSFKHNPSSNEDALKSRRPTSSFMKGNDFAGRLTMKKYVHNPQSNKNALDVMAPGRAMARIRDYQGNIKMNKPAGKNLHPDAQFVHDRNVKQQRTFLVNIKLKWAKLFRRSGNQPDAVKEKVRRPRYDKKEKELWKDLYD